MKTSVKHMATLSISWMDKSLLKTTAEEITSKFFGIPEKDTDNGSDPEVWEECEADPYKVKD